MNPVWRTLLGAVLISAAHITSGQTLALPPRPAEALTREQIIRMLVPLTREAREDTLFRIILSGNIPDFLRALVPVSVSATVGDTCMTVTYFVTPEYLSIGSDERPLLIPMTPLLAQRLADTMGCTLPTRKMVNDIYAASTLKLPPAPIPPSAAMITVPAFIQHDSIVWTQRAPACATHPMGTLTGGTKKDVIVSNRIRNEIKPGVPKPVVIYGWHRLDGSPIQPLYNGHGETYADYSHGIRLVLKTVVLNGTASTVRAILQSDTLCTLLSDEGVINHPRY